MSASVADIRLLNKAREELSEIIESKIEAIAGNIAADFPDYKYRCGEVAGIRTALDVLSEIVRKMGDQRL
ncbi:hypothetical protein [Rhizobium lusitanum]|uniref:Uncharacterized protein n=1 Tax=Rhizobium lusitanum TaxID=293958 RepID=A0A1C3VS68_9HYPH|nr:hypothetical protein [Rhizobium lusitanum]SCB30354.1 hypothetical protein GA0061101_10697 [Rhizobium lusitanum]